MKAPLGKDTAYPEVYDAGILYPIRRSESRSKLNFLINDQLFPKGFDIWNAYEVSWLNLKGKPEVRIAKFLISADSENIIESKSFKLYLNGFNQARFASEESVLNLMQSDISKACMGDVELHFEQVNKLDTLTSSVTSSIESETIWHSLDTLDIEINEYDRQENLLSLDSIETSISEKLSSHLFKTNCPVTGQPDWASIYIFYKGVPINHQSLLTYLISFRQHQDFHEHCVEQIYVDLMNQCHPKALMVMARYTRRGGLDINPVRFSENAAVEYGSGFDALLYKSQIRLNRQ